MESRCHVVSVSGSVPVYHVDSLSMQGHLTLSHRATSKRSAVASSENPTNTTFVFSHADLLALRVQYHAPVAWRGPKANSARRRETVHFRLSADGVQSARDSFQIVIADASPTIQDGGDGHVTAAAAGSGSTLMAAALTSGLAVTAAVVAVVAVVLVVFRRRRRPKHPPGSRQVSDGEKWPRTEGVKRGRTEGEVDQLPEVVLVAVSSPAATPRPPPSGVVRRQPVAVDWSNVDPEIVQHCRTTDPVLHSDKVWV